MVATNLFGRGMDIERVNIVFNYDMPEDSDTYLHRVARAGRFGTKVCSFFDIFKYLSLSKFFVAVLMGFGFLKLNCPMTLFFKFSLSFR